MISENYVERVLDGQKEGEWMHMVMDTEDYLMYDDGDLYAR